PRERRGGLRGPATKVSQLMPPSERVPGVGEQPKLDGPSRSPPLVPIGDAGARARWRAGSGASREAAYHWQAGSSKQRTESKQIPKQTAASVKCGRSHDSLHVVPPRQSSSLSHASPTLGAFPTSVQIGAQPVYGAVRHSGTDKRAVVRAA